MTNTIKWKFYKAFGLNICSQINIDILKPSIEKKADVSIVKTNLSKEKQKLKKNQYYYFEPNKILMFVPDVGYFLIVNGNTIYVEINRNAQPGLLAVYLMGSCFGAILHQRGILPLHGSCVTKNNQAILFIGNSGAGKSTIAAEFMKHGWQLLTDDISVITGIEKNCPLVHSSYPSQKLWQDAIDKYDRGDSKRPLYQENRKDKFGVNVNNFYEGQARLTKIVRLMVSDNKTYIEKINGFDKVDQIITNTYRSFMIEQPQKQVHFQRCVTLGSQISMLFANRKNNEDCASYLYNKILSFDK